MSRISLQGLKQAIEVAREYQAELTVMNVTDDFFHADKSSTYYTSSMNLFLGEVARLKKVIRGLHELDAKSYHCLGNPAHEIAEYARKEGSDLIVMATHGRSGLKKVLLGSVASKVIHQAETNVMLVRAIKDQRSWRSFRFHGNQPVVVPFEFTRASVACLEMAGELGIQPERIVAVHVVEPLGTYDRQGLSRQRREANIRAKNREKFYDNYCPAGMQDCEFRTFFDMHVSKRIRKFATENDAGLILIPTNRKGFLSRFFLGSVTDSIAQKAKCPVMIVKSEIPVSRERKKTSRSKAK